MIYFFYGLNFLLMILMPLVVGWLIAKKRHAGWGLFGMGAVTFVASQILHLPFNWLVLQRFQLLPEDTTLFTNLLILALFLGLSAGVFEEVARYLTFRFWARDARTWGKGLMVGAGHGGIEAILLGLLGGVNFVILAIIRNGGLSQLVPPEQTPQLEAALAELFSAPWHLILLGALERLWALCFHLAASLLVMQVFVRGRIRWLFAAILWHAFLDGLAVVAVSTWNVYVTEALLAVPALLSVGIVFWLRTPEPVAPQLEPLPEAGPAPPVEVEQTAEMLDKSRYV